MRGPCIGWIKISRRWAKARSTLPTWKGPRWARFALPTLLPRPVIDGVLVGSAGHRHIPLDGPVIGVVEPLAGIGLRRGVEKAPRLELVGLQEAIGLGDEIVD